MNRKTIASLASQSTASDVQFEYGFLTDRANMTQECGENTKKARASSALAAKTLDDMARTQASVESLV